MKSILILLASAFSSTTFASVSIDVCQHSVWQKEGLRYQTGKFTNGRCFISVGPTDTYKLLYRNFLFNDEGKLLVFNSFGEGPSSTHTGARVFHLWPLKAQLKAERQQEKLIITLPSNHQAIFDIKSGKLEELLGTQIQIDGEIDPSNNGGVELAAEAGLILDSGFKLGGTPLSSLSSTSTFSNNQLEKCRVKNRYFFTKKGDEIYFLYRNIQDFKSQLKKRCPDLELDF